MFETGPLLATMSQFAENLELNVSKYVPGTWREELDPCGNRSAMGSEPATYIQGQLYGVHK